MRPLVMTRTPSESARMAGLPATERFLLLSQPGENGCRDWIGAKTAGGYGLWTLNGKQTTAHRIAYILFVGEIPEGHVIDHLCRNKLCVNVTHLEAVTQLENSIRSGNAKTLRMFATHCVHGHEFTEENTYWMNYGAGRRQCRACRQIRDRSRRRG